MFPNLDEDEEGRRDFSRRAVESSYIDTLWAYVDSLFIPVVRRWRSSYTFYKRGVYPFQPAVINQAIIV